MQTEQIATLKLSVVKTVPVNSNTTKKWTLFVRAKLKKSLCIPRRTSKCSENVYMPASKKFLLNNYDIKDWVTA